jgi:hypothetical protein
LLTKIHLGPPCDSIGKQREQRKEESRGNRFKEEKQSIQEVK